MLFHECAGRAMLLIGALMCVLAFGAMVAVEVPVAFAAESGARLGDAGAFTQAVAIVLREGLEAIVVIAALLSALRLSGVRGYARYIWGGAALAIAASFGLWLAANRLIVVSDINREVLEGITALLAAALLVFVTHWIFHKTYVTDWLQFVKGSVREIAGRGSMAAIGSLAFFVVFREGFETVLFYEALLMNAAPAPVLGGFAAGAFGSFAVAFAVLGLGMRLPVAMFFKVTGVLLAALAVVFAGVGVHALQEAGLIGETPVPGIPDWPALRHYFGLFPLAEPLLLQGALAILFFGGWLRLRSAAARRMREA